MSKPNELKLSWKPFEQGLQYDFINNNQSGCVGLIGESGSGRKTIVRELIETWKKKNSKNKIYAHDRSRRFSEFVHFDLTDKENFWSNKYEEGSLIIIHNYYELMDKDKDPFTGKVVYTPKKGMVDFLMRIRQKSHHVIYTYHGPDEFIPLMSGVTTQSLIFKTDSEQKEFNQRVIGGSLLAKTALVVNSYCNTIGSKAKHPKFPHIVVDMKEAKNGVYPVNIDKGILHGIQIDKQS